MFNKACCWSECCYKKSIGHLNGKSNEGKPPPNYEGLGTGLKPDHYKPKPPKGRFKVEQCLELLETELRTKVLEKGQTMLHKTRN
eukprot:15365871-Ditylum_brightwellii.AAC.1